MSSKNQILANFYVISMIAAVILLNSIFPLFFFYLTITYESEGIVFSLFFIFSTKFDKSFVFCAIVCHFIAVLYLVSNFPSFFCNNKKNNCFFQFQWKNMVCFILDTVIVIEQSTISIFVQNFRYEIDSVTISQTMTR